MQTPPLLQYAKKFRILADALDDLFGVSTVQMRVIDAQLNGEILQHAKQLKAANLTNGNGSNGYVERRGRKKGFKYNGTHWTQQRKNRKMLLRVTRTAKRAQIRAAKTRRTSRRRVGGLVPRKDGSALHHRGLHWTQKPENAAKLKTMTQRGWLSKKRKTAVLEAAAK